MSSDAIWEAIRSETEKEIAKEPFLGSFMHATILKHDTLETALSYHLAAKLESPALNALSTAGPVELIAMADVFSDRLELSRKSLKDRFGDQVNVPPERQFLGMDAYKKAIAEIAPGGVALLTTPPVGLFGELIRTAFVFAVIAFLNSSASIWKFSSVSTTTGTPPPFPT